MNALDLQGVVLHLTEKRKDFLLCLRVLGGEIERVFKKMNHLLAGAEQRVQIGDYLCVGTMQFSLHLAHPGVKKHLADDQDKYQRK